MRSRNRKGEGGRLRTEVIEAGMRVLAAAGDARAVTIRAVATAAGVTPPSIYRYFPDRAALLHALTEESFRQFDAALAAAADGVADPADRLRRQCLEYLAFAMQRPGLYRIAFGTAGLGPDELGVAAGDAHPGRSSLDALIAAVTACAHPEPTGAAIRLWCFLHGLAELRAGKPELPWPSEAEMVDGMLADIGCG